MRGTVTYVSALYSDWSRSYCLPRATSQRRRTPVGESREAKQ